ncbi:MAG TPA: alpha/beta fold hydrolase [Spirochaetia bacterium]|nr:alpha/beta fold hydrolase [Spirochaetia bacterium]
MSNENPSDEVPADARRAFVGLWQGIIEAGGGRIRLVFDVREEPGRLTAVASSPDQVTADIPVASVVVDGENICFDVPETHGVYEGTINRKDNSIIGKWKQAGSSFAVDLSRIEHVVRVRRPQDPVPPFPYTTREVVITNTAAAISLSGTLTIPQGDGPFPAALLVTGSGPQNRDEEIFNHRPFLVIADYLARRGIATLRCDDRGVGGSGGNGQIATESDLTDDAISAVDYLQSQPEIAAARVGVIGHSEGGIIAPRVAQARPELGFIVLLAGTGWSGHEVLLQQTAAILRAGGAPEAQINATVDANRSIYDAILAEPDNTRVLERLKPMMEKLGVPPDQIGPQAETVITPWFRSFLSSDPALALTGIQCPVLAMNGAKDVQVLADLNLDAIARAVHAGGNMRVEIVKFEGLNHLFQHATTGLPQEYGQIQETFAPEVLEKIGDWILSQTK